MPPWPPRPQSNNPNGTISYTPSTQGDINRPLPLLPSMAVELDLPTLYPHRRAEEDGTSAKHGRSFSHPFPFFGTGSKRSQRRVHPKNKIGVDSTDDDSIDDGHSNNRSSNVPLRKPCVTAGSEPMTGKCMACDSTVRWPRELRVFRCTICLTVNDLEPSQGTSQQPPSSSRQNAHASFIVPRKPVPLSLERTRAIIEHCIEVYLDARHHEKTAAAAAAQNGPEPTPRPRLHFRGKSNDHQSRPSLQTRRPSESRSYPVYPSPDAARSSDASRGGVSEPLTITGSHLDLPCGNSRNAETSDISDQDCSSKPRLVRGSIFRPLENYVTSCFAGCNILNRSFLTVRPEFQRAASEGQSARAETNRPHLSPPGSDNVLCEVEVDAKTLLLGEIGENSSWWTGGRLSRGQSTHLQGRERSPESCRGVVNLKCPRINWTEVAAWYQSVLNAGESWRDKWAAKQARSSSELLADGDAGAKGASQLLTEIEDDLAESRNHLQRVLLKATENLLKRPRRPLKHPEDCRFLLIILANPLLLPESSPVARRSNPHSPAKRPGSVQHSGVVKRVLGLMAHLPNEVHQVLVLWFSRLPESQLSLLVDLVGGFVTYRLSRPSQKRELINPTDGLVPSFSDSGSQHAARLHAVLGGSRSTSSRPTDSSRKPQLASYGDDWQVRAAARVMALLFAANGGHASKKRDAGPNQFRSHSVGAMAKYNAHAHGQLIPISNFYNTLLDYADLVADFEIWESNRGKFSFCQYPFFLSIYAKIHLMEVEARRQMEIKAREAFFDSILSNKAVSQFLVLKVRRDCLVEDSLRRISEVVGSGQGDIKKSLKIEFVGEEGVDAGGLRKEWFLLFVRELFDEGHGLFVYDEDSRLCYFNPYSFESSEQYFLVGVVTGLAIYNSAILDIAFPPFVFKKLLASAPITANITTSAPRSAYGNSLEDLAELRPALARGLRQLLEYDGNVQETFCRDFVVEEDRYGECMQIPLCPDGEKLPVTNSNRGEFVDMYIKYLLDTSVSRQYEPFKRGFFTVCGGNALSLFRPEEIELLIRGSDEPLDIYSLRAVAVYEGWPAGRSKDQHAQVQWFWEAFEGAKPVEQRKLLAFITGSDRIPAMGATNLVIKIQLQDTSKKSGILDTNRFPTARTCFNTLVLYPYRSKEQLEQKLWMAVSESEGFGLK